MSRGQCQPGLACTARPGERDHAVVGDRRRDPCQFTGPPNEPCCRLREGSNGTSSDAIVSGHGLGIRSDSVDVVRQRHPVQRRFVLQDGPLEPLQVRAGFDAELFDELLSGGVERPQCLSLAARTVEGEDQLGPESFPQRMIGDELAKCRHDGVVVAENQPGFDLALECRRSQLEESFDLGYGE